MFLKQLSVFLENKHGRLAEVTSLLAENSIDIRSISVADTTDYGILRLVVNYPEKAAELLQKEGFTVSLTNVLGVSIEDATGALSRVITLLCEQDISIDYGYAFLTPTEGSACVILRVEDSERAVKVLEEAGVRLMSNEEVRAL